MNEIVIEIKVHLPFSPDQKDCEPVTRTPDGGMSWGMSRAVTVSGVTVARAASDDQAAPDENNA